MNVQRPTNRTQPQHFIVNVCLTAIIAALLAVAPGNLFANEGNATQATAAETVTIDLKIDKPEALVAERVQLQITATGPLGVKVQFPELEKQLGDFEVIRVKDTPDIPAGDSRKWIRKIVLESLVSGDLQIPAMEISYVDRRGSTPFTGVQKTSPQPVVIRSTLEGTEDPTQFRDIKSVVFLPEPETQTSHWLAWSAGLAGFLVVAAAVVALVRRKSTLSPIQHAIQALQELKASRSVAEQDAEQVYVRIVSIVRTFVYEQFGISAPRLTTREFLDALQADQRLSDEFRGELSELLNLADMVKFAGLLPSGGLDEVVDQAVRLVENAAEQSPLTTDSAIPTAGEK